MDEEISIHHIIGFPKMHMHIRGLPFYSPPDTFLSFIQSTLLGSPPCHSQSLTQPVKFLKNLLPPILDSLNENPSFLVILRQSVGLDGKGWVVGPLTVTRSTPPSLLGVNLHYVSSFQWTHHSEGFLDPLVDGWIHECPRKRGRTPKKQTPAASPPPSRY
jgi:hypothetical protein